MAYADLMTARSNFGDFGSMLSSIQENAQDVLAQDTQEDETYKGYKAQLQQTGLFEAFPGTLLFAENAYKAGKSIYTGFNRAAEALPKIQELGLKAQQAGNDVVDIIKNSGQQASDVLENTFTDVKDKISSGIENVQEQAAAQIENIASGATTSSSVVEAKRAELLERYPARENQINSLSPEDVIARHAKQTANDSQKIEEINSESAADDAVKIASAREAPRPVVEASSLPDTNLEPITYISRAKFVAGGEEGRSISTSQLAIGGDELAEEGGSVLNVYSEASRLVNPRGLMSSFSNRVGGLYNKLVGSAEEGISSVVNKIPGFLNIQGGTTLPINRAVKPATAAADEGGTEMKTFADLAPEGQAEASSITSQIVQQSAERAVMPTAAAISRPAVETVASSVESTASDVAHKVGSVADDAMSAGKSVLSGVGDDLSTIAKGAAEEVGERVGLLAAEAIPVVGEVLAAGLGIYQGIQGFKDLFSHPTAPKIQAMPQVANIAQSFQSGI